MGNFTRVVEGAAHGVLGAGKLPHIAGVGFELATIPMLLMDDLQQIRCANAASVGMFDTQDVVGRSIFDFCLFEDELHAREAIAALTIGEFDGLEQDGVSMPESGRRRVSMRMDLVTPPGQQRMFLIQLQLLGAALKPESAWSATETHFRQLVSSEPGRNVVMFDRDLRLLKAGGEVQPQGQYNIELLTGKLLSDVVPPAMLTLMECRFRDALAGHEADFDYDSPIDGRQYRVRLRPIIDDHGAITSGLAVSEDVTAERVRQTQLEQMQQLSNVGTISFDTVRGWRADGELMALLGVDTSDEAQHAIDTLVLPEDQGPTRSAYRVVLATGGQTTVQYRMIHGKTGQLRHILGSIKAVVAADGLLLRALATHADVTEVVQAQAAKVTAARGRTMLLRSVSDAFTQAPGSVRSMMQSILDITTAVLGDSTVLRVLTSDASGVEVDMVSDSNVQAKQRMANGLCESARTFVADPATLDATGPAGTLLSTLHDQLSHTDFERRLDVPVDQPIHHFISAAVRHDGIVLGYLHVYRTDLTKPYEDGDDHLVQVLADRIGSAIAESRVRELLERQRAERSATATRLRELMVEQRDLLEQLSGVEERERILLAEALHDGPMQLVVAVMMRLENLGMIGGPTVQDGLDLSIETLETSISDLRTLIIALTPPDLSRGLGVALRQLAEGIFMGTATEITVLGQAHVNLTALSKGNAHRILREALVNARKHAQARHVVLELTEQDSFVVARLTDNGVGAVSLDAGPGHLGVATMRARADAEGARLDITSTPGSGTVVVLTLPTAVPAAVSTMSALDTNPQWSSYDQP